MSENNTIRVKLFGSLREFGDAEKAELVMPQLQSVGELREKIRSLFREKYPDSNAAELIGECAFADEKVILNADSSLEGRTFIAVLPPVCGG